MSLKISCQLQFSPYILVHSPSTNSVGSYPAIMAVKRSPSMNDSHYSTIKFPTPSNEASNGETVSDRIASRIAADKAAFFAERQEPQQIYENVGKGKFTSYNNGSLFYCNVNIFNSSCHY